MQAGIHVVFTWNFPEHASRVISTLHSLKHAKIVTLFNPLSLQIATTLIEDIYIVFVNIIMWLLPRI